MGVVVPGSPVSSDGLCTTQVDNSGNHFGLDMGGLRGRKRIIDGPVEKVERRQRRMIKNRESAARSRARKQANCIDSTQAAEAVFQSEVNKLKQDQFKPFVKGEAA